MLYRTRAFALNIWITEVIDRDFSGHKFSSRRSFRLGPPTIVHGVLFGGGVLVLIVCFKVHRLPCARLVDHVYGNVVCVLI